RYCTSRVNSSKGGYQILVVVIHDQLVEVGHGLKAKEAVDITEGGDGYQINGATDGVSIKIRRQGLVDGHGVQQISGHAIEHDPTTVFRRCRADAIYGHGIEVCVHAAYRDVAPLTLVILDHDARYAAQGFTDVDVGKIADRIGINHSGHLVGITLALDGALHAGARADYLDLFDLLTLGLHLYGGQSNQHGNRSCWQRRSIFTHGLLLFPVAVLVCPTFWTGSAKQRFRSGEALRDYWLSLCQDDGIRLIS